MSDSASYSPIVSKIYKSRNVLLTILESRGFNVDDYKGFSVSEVHAMYANKQLDMLCTDNTGTRRVYVKYHLSPKSGFTKVQPKYIYEAIDDLYDLEMALNPSDELIIIAKERMNDTIKNLVRELYANDKKFINIYNLNDYLFNILEHSLVPPHRILSKDAQDAISKQYNIANPSQFPEIDRFDPVAQAIGIRPGQLCEIKRKSPTAVETKYYRLCY